MRGKCINADRKKVCFIWNLKHYFVYLHPNQINKYVYLGYFHASGLAGSADVRYEDHE